MQTEFWNRIVQNTATYDDIEAFIYSKEYLQAWNSKNFFEFDGKEYHPDLNTYMFEVETYASEEEYEEVFFQAYLDGDFSREEYLYHENKFLNFMQFLFSKSSCYISVYFDIPLRKNSPFSKSKDIAFNIEDLNALSDSDKVSLIKDETLFNQLCIIAAREINTVDFVFPALKLIVQPCGMHGVVLSENKFNEREIADFSRILTFFEYDKK